jgi:hypothetical protein
MATAWTIHVCNGTLFLMLAVPRNSSSQVSSGRRQSHAQMVFGFLSQILVSAWRNCPQPRLELTSHISQIQTTYLRPPGLTWRLLASGVPPRRFVAFFVRPYSSSPTSLPRSLYVLVSISLSFTFLLFIYEFFCFDVLSPSHMLITCVFSIPYPVTSLTLHRRYKL